MTNHTAREPRARVEVGRLTGVELRTLDQPDSCLWRFDQETMKKAAKRLRYLEREVTALRREARS